VLQKLAIISNQLTGEIPNNIGQSTGLVRLRLSNNSLSGMYCTYLLLQLLPE
jgi:hypothetical protein